MKPFLLFSFSILFISSVFAQESIFQVLRKKDHSSFDGFITSIYRDSDGFLWFGSSQGLVRYDGSSYMRFDYQKDDTTTLSHSDIETIFEDNKHRLWFGSKYGLNLYNKESQSFRRYYPYPDPKGNINKNRIKAITQQNDSILWMSSYGGGVCKFNINTGVFKNFITSNVTGSLPSDIINYVYIDSKKRLWIGSESGGLSLMDTQTGHCKNYLPNTLNPNSLSDATVSAILEDNHGYLWIGTWRGGLNRFDPRTETFMSFTDKFPSKTIRMIVKGKGDIIWLATYKGIIKLNTDTYQSQLYLNDPLEPKSLLYDVNWAIYFDQEDILWIGTMGKGVCYTNLSNHPFRIPEKWDVKFRNTYINTLQLDGTKLWIGTDDSGVLYYDLHTNKIIQSEFNKLFTGQVVYGISKDSKGQIWIGTNLGLYCVKNKKQKQNIPFSPIMKGFSIYSVVEDGQGGYIAGGWNTGLISFKENKPNDINVFKVGNQVGLPADIIWKIFVDKEKRLWVLTSAGIGLWNPITNKFKLLFNDPNIFAINQDDNGLIWCGTSFGEIIIFDNDKKEFKHFYKFTEEPYRIAAIHFSKKNLWITTQNGLIRLNKSSKLHRRFTVADGLPSNYFTWAHETLPNGEIIIGTANGPVIINPENLGVNKFKPNLVITSVEVFDKKRNFVNNTIQLRYFENKISIGFTALAFSSNGIVTYTYKLTGVDDEEVVTTENKAVYTNLDHGTYKFSVSYETADGIKSNTPTILTITVETPWWQTWWFKLFIVLIIALAVLGIYFNRVRSIRQRNKELEQEVLKRTSQLNVVNETLNKQNITLQQRKLELEKLNDTKTKLFSIIGHDLKNPMSVIIQLTELLNDSYDKYNSTKRKEFIAAINNSSRNAYLLLMNLLDWARSQKDELYISFQSIDITACLNDIINLNKISLQKKQIQIQIINTTDLNAFADLNLLQTCLRNLISNAIKFSKSNSTIVVEVKELHAERIEITITDAGVGMSADSLNNIFSIQKHTQVGTDNEKGTGLGMIIVKEFISLLKGTIYIESEVNKGTKIGIEISATSIPPLKNELEVLEFETSKNISISPNLLDEESITFLKGKTIIIIDDDADLRNGLQTILEEFAIVIVADDGDNGLKLITEKHPDLIICDVEMPRMNGIEVCTNIKTNIDVSHIPFILLTALDSETDTIKGLQAGADEYITKPFNRSVLLLKINNVFKLQQNLHIRYKVNESIQVESGSIASLDEKLLSKIIDVIQKYIADADFGVEQLSDAIGMHRTNLHRKMRTLTGENPGDFIKMIRLKKAAELLKTGKLSVSEVAYDSGFNDVKYFGKCFKEHFGKSPTEYNKG